MQIVSLDNLHEMPKDNFHKIPKPIFLRKIKKKNQNVVCWIFTQHPERKRHMKPFGMCFVN